MALSPHLEVQGSQYLLKPGRGHDADEITHTHTQAHIQKTVIFAIVVFNSKPLAPVSPGKNQRENNEVNENDVCGFNETNDYLNVTFWTWRSHLTWQGGC